MTHRLRGEKVVEDAHCTLPLHACYYAVVFLGAFAGVAGCEDRTGGRGAASVCARFVAKTMRTRRELLSSGVGPEAPEAVMGGGGAQRGRVGLTGLRRCHWLTTTITSPVLCSLPWPPRPLPRARFRHVGHSGCSVSLPSCPLRFSLTPSQEAHPDYRYDSSFPVLASPTHRTQSSLPMASPSARSSASRIPSPSSLSMQSRHTRPVS